MDHVGNGKTTYINEISEKMNLTFSSIQNEVQQRYRALFKGNTMYQRFIATNTTRSVKNSYNKVLVKKTSQVQIRRE